jgi:glycosyltransferase involved in cell wall biosynthesis
MRIAHVITRLIVGGAQENTILNCQDLIEDFGDEVLLITGPGLGPEGSLEDDARKRGVPLAIIPELRRAIHPWRDWQSFRAMTQILSEWRPDVVHTHSGKAGLLGRIIAARLRVPAIIHTVHGAPFHEYQGRAAREFFRRCEAYASARCHRILCVAHAMTDRLVRAGVTTREKCVRVFSGMEIEPYLEAQICRDSTRQRLGIHPDDFVVTKLARLFHLKGHHDFIEAARLAATRLPNLRLLFVGDGILRKQIEAQTERAGLAGRCHFTGLVPPAAIPSLLAASDVVVHCSLREGLARVLPQALIAGRPVISYDIDGAREVVANDRTGYLVRPGNTDKLAMQIVRLAWSPRLRARLARKGRRGLAHEFDHRRTTRQIRDVYAEILSNSDAGR